jgi:hypothetical protein
VKKYPQEDVVLPPVSALKPNLLHGNLDMGSSEAERAYYHCDFNKAYKIAVK